MSRAATSVLVGLAALGCRVEAPAETATSAASSGLTEAPTTGTGTGTETGDRGEVTDPAIIPAAPVPPERALGVVDAGVFADLDGSVQLALPEPFEPSRAIAVVDPSRALLLLYLDHWPVKVYPLREPEAVGASPLTLAGRRVWLRPGDHAELGARLAPDTPVLELAAGDAPAPGDRDGDGIPDPLDLSLGALKTTLNAASYNQDYARLDYPGGDVSRELGACTDVIVRALRNAGVDLQVAVHEDIARAPRRYPMVDRANPDIDHRRVRTLLPWFRGHWRALADTDPLAPGDVIFMDTIASRRGPDHIGIVGDRQGEGGRYLIANNWTDGSTTAFMDLLAFVEVGDRFRMPPAPEHAGPVPATAAQLVVVRGDAWDGFRGEARRFERAEAGGAWRPVGPAFAVVLGHAGLGWGRGLHGDGRPPGVAVSVGPDKREGDGRSPAGVFTIGPRYARPGPGLRCVDDPRSRAYAAIVDVAELDEAARDWASAERMAELYPLAIVVEHNRGRIPGEGSCIFLHAWAGSDQPVTGCTAMDPAALAELAEWLRPGAVVVSLPGSSYASLASAWALPDFDALTDAGGGG